MNPDHMDNIELLNFCDEGTDGQKKSFMILLDTLTFHCGRQSGEVLLKICCNMLASTAWCFNVGRRAV